MPNKRNYEMIMNVNGAVVVPSINLYNTDRNIFNLAVKIQSGTGKNAIILEHDEVVNMTLKLKVIKPKTNQYREIDGVLDSEGKFVFELPETFNDTVGAYKCQLFLTNTMGTADNNSDDEIVTSKDFKYTILSSILTGISAEIVSNPDTEVLKDLIDQVKELKGDIVSGNLTTEDRANLDKIGTGTLTTTDKTIIGAVNELDSDIGDKSTLTTTAKSNVISAINELDDEIGDLTSLTTDEKGKIVDAINEIDEHVGNEADLTTTAKSDIVSAVNELDGDIGDKATLKTTAKGDLVAGINEIYDNVGDKANLTTTEKGNLVGAVNELDNEIGDLSTLTTNGKDKLVGAINELDGDIGDKTTLKTTDKTNVVAAINELFDDKVNVDDIIDNLTSTDIDKALSANQGKVLKDDMGNKDDLTTTAKTDLVSAINELDVELGESRYYKLSTDGTGLEVVADDADPVEATQIKLADANQYGGTFVVGNKVVLVESTGIYNKIDDVKKRIENIQVTGSTIEIVDNLTSTDADKALSANQGKVLKDDMGNKANLTTTANTNLVGAINELDDDLGDKNSLTTTAKSDIVSAINELDNEVGDLSTLTTTAQDKVVNAINELDLDLGDKANLTTTAKSDIVSAINEHDDEIGDLSTLTTTSQDNLVDAINEIDGDVGDKTTLKTTAKNDVVSAVNELFDDKVNVDDIIDNLTSTDTDKPLSANQGKALKDDIGDKSTLTTTAKADLVSAVNELDSDVGDKATLTTVEKGNLVGAVNELDGEIGDLSTLATTDKDTVVGAINEIYPEVERKTLTPSANEVTLDKTPTQNMSINADTTINIPTNLAFRKVELDVACTDSNPKVLTFKQGAETKKIKIAAESYNVFTVRMNGANCIISKESDKDAVLTDDDVTNGIEN